MAYALTFILLGTTIATLLGAVFGIFIKKLHKELITFLVNFCLGAMISLIFLELLQHSFHHVGAFYKDNQGIAVLVTLSTIFISGMLFYLLHELLHCFTHHHHHDHNDCSPCHDHAHTTEIFNSEDKSLAYASFIFLIAIFIHNIPEGLALGISFSEMGDNSIPINGIITSCILFIHNFIIGFTMCTSFLKANKSNSFSIVMTTVSSLPALVLGYTGYFVSSIQVNELFKGMMLAISTGSLIYVLLVELVPQSFIEYKSKYTFIYVLLGIVLNTLFMNLADFM